jgi:integrase/recombinase XerD
MLPQAQAFLTDLVSHKARNVNTCQAYRGDLERLAVYLMNSLGHPACLEDISATEIAAFLENERRCGYRPSTLARRKAVLRQYARYLKSHSAKKTQFEAIESVLETEITPSHATETGGTHLSDSQIESLVALLNASTRPLTRRDRAIFSTLLHTGISVGYLVGLDCEDFVPNKRKLRGPINGHWIQVSSEGAGKDLVEYLSKGRPELNPAATEKALFISQTGGRMSRQGVWQNLRVWGSRAGLKFPLTPRILQYSAIHQLCTCGISIEDLGERLGHTNQESTRALLRRLGIQRT